MATMFSWVMRIEGSIRFANMDRIDLGWTADSFVGAAGALRGAK